MHIPPHNSESMLAQIERIGKCEAVFDPRGCLGNWNPFDQKLHLWTETLVGWALFRETGFLGAEGAVVLGFFGIAPFDNRPNEPIGLVVFREAYAYGNDNG